jgi:hypothetical protein
MAISISTIVNPERFAPVEDSTLKVEGLDCLDLRIFSPLTFNLRSCPFFVTGKWRSPDARRDVIASPPEGGRGNPTKSLRGA